MFAKIFFPESSIIINIISKKTIVFKSFSFFRSDNMNKKRSTYEFSVNNRILIFYPPTIFSKDLKIGSIIDELYVKAKAGMLTNILIDCSSLEVAFTQMSELLIKLSRLNLERGSGFVIKICTLEERIKSFLKETKVFDLFDYFENADDAIASFNS